MKNLKCIYEAYIPRILRNKNQIKYNLSEENIFGNLHYSMSQDILKGKNIKMDYSNINILKENKFNNNPSKLLPILRIKPS
jgi:hypothetical protein